MHVWRPAHRGGNCPAALRQGLRHAGTGVLKILAVVLAAAFTLGMPRESVSQVSFHIAAGARYGSTLVRDSIVTPFTVRPFVAPALSGAALMPLKHGWSAAATLDASITHMTRHDADGTTTGLGRLSTVMFCVGARRDITKKLSAGVDIGGLKYIPADESGIFKLGAGPIAGVGGLVMEWQLSHGLAVEARYDIHSFNTPALEAEGFTSATLVQRFTLSLTGETGSEP